MTDKRKLEDHPDYCISGTVETSQEKEVRLERELRIAKLEKELSELKKGENPKLLLEEDKKKPPRSKPREVHHHHTTVVNKQEDDSILGLGTAVDVVAGVGLLGAFGLFD